MAQVDDRESQNWRCSRMDVWTAATQKCVLFGFRKLCEHPSREVYLVLHRIRSTTCPRSTWPFDADAGRSRRHSDCSALCHGAASPDVSHAGRHANSFASCFRIVHRLASHCYTCGACSSTPCTEANTPRDQSGYVTFASCTEKDLPGEPEIFAIPVQI